MCMKSTFISFCFLSIFCLVQFVANAQIPTLGLVGDYQFSGNANDNSGLANNGTVYGASLTADRFGNANSAYNFSGTDYILIPNSSSLNPAAQMSISVWVNTLFSHSNGGIIGKWNQNVGGSGGAEQYVVVANSSGVNFALKANGQTTISEGTATYNNGAWHHYCAVWDGIQVRLYRDNILVSSANQSGTISAYNQFLEIGRYVGGLNSAVYFKGKIDDIRIYNRGLTATEVTSLFNEPNPVIVSSSSPGSIASWSKISNTSGNLGNILPSNNRFGGDVTSIGDLNNDGIEDMIVGTPFYSYGTYSNCGVLYVLFMNADNTVNHKTLIHIGAQNFNPPGFETSYGYLGCSVANIGDFNNDGINDIVAGSEAYNKVYLLMLDTNGSVKTTYTIGSGIGGMGAVSGYFGTDVKGIGDIDGDGVKDIAASAYGGALYLIRMNANGTVKNYSTLLASSFGQTNNFGIAFDTLGDIDNNGYKDFIVGNNTINNSIGLATIIKMTTNYNVLSYSLIGNGSSNFTLLYSNDLLGTEVSCIGDIDGDGVSDVFIGAPGDDAGGTGTNYGAGYVVFLNSNGEVKSYYKINKLATNFLSPLDLGDYFGISCAPLGDLNNDGILEFGVGSVYDDDGANDAGGLYILSLNRAFSVYASSQNPQCFGECTGSINLTTVGGTGTISYLWNTGQTTSSRTNLCVGTYTCTVTNQADTLIKSVTITQPTKNMVIASNDTGVCIGNCTSISATGTGGISPYFYMWNQGLNLGQTKTVCPTTTTNYTVTRIDANNCSSDADTVIVTAIPLPTAAIIGLSFTYCSYENLDTLQGSPAGGTFTGSGISGNVFNPSVGGYGTRYITYTVGVNGCSDTAMQLVTVNSVPVVNITALSSSYCKNVTPISLIATPIGGVFSGNGVVGNTFNPSMVSAGYHVIGYSFTNANNCTSIDTQWVKVNANPIALAGSNQSITPGSSITLMGNATAGSGAYSYFWTPSDSFYYPAVQNATTKPLFTNNNFILTVTDLSNNCQGKDTVSVFTQLTPILSNSVATPSSICQGFSSQITSTTTGGMGNFTYTWTSNPAGFSSNLPNPIVNPMITTNYLVAISDGFSTVFDTVMVVVNNSPQADLGNDTLLCNSNSFVLSVNNVIGNQYVWSTGSTVNSIQVPTATMSDGHYWYSITVTNSTNCVSKDSIKLSVSKIQEINLGSDTSFCKNSSLVLNAGSGYSTYLWQDGSSLQSFLADSTLGLGPHLIQVKVYNSYGCIERDTIVLTINTCIGLEESDEFIGVRIYPNPTEDKIYIESDFACKIELLDQTGRLLEMVNKSEDIKSIFINLFQYSSGVYYIKIIDLDRIYTKKIIRN